MTKPRRRWLLLLLLVALGAMNAVAFFHAWRLTHFSPAAGARTPPPSATPRR